MAVAVIVIGMLLVVSIVAIVATIIYVNSAPSSSSTLSTSSTSSTTSSSTSSSTPSREEIRLQQQQSFMRKNYPEPTLASCTDNGGKQKVYFVKDGIRHVVSPEIEGFNLAEKTLNTDCENIEAFPEGSPVTMNNTRCVIPLPYPDKQKDYRSTCTVEYCKSQTRNDKLGRSWAQMYLGNSWDSETQLLNLLQKTDSTQPTYRWDRRLHGGTFTGNVCGCTYNAGENEKCASPRAASHEYKY